MYFKNFSLQSIKYFLLWKKWTDKLNEVHFLCIISTTEFVAEATVAEQFKVATVLKFTAGYLETFSI